MTNDNNKINRTDTFGPQMCECGHRKYVLHGVIRDSGTDLVAACADCGRITGSFEDGPKYRGKKIDEL